MQDDREVLDFRHFKQAVDHMAHHVMITDAQGIIQYVNAAFEKTTGYSQDEIIGAKPSILKSGQQGHRYYKSLWQTVLSGKRFSAIVVNKKKNGELYYADQIVTPIVDPQGRVKNFVSTWDDVTDRKEWEVKLQRVNRKLVERTEELKESVDSVKGLYEELKEQNEKLQELDRLKSDFVSTVSHELRTPLAISMEGINLILDGIVGDFGDKQKVLLSTSRDNLKRLNRIIDDLLDIAKIESGKIELHPVFMDVGRFFHQISEAFQPVVASKNVSLTANLPPAGTSIYADKDKVTQIVTNLLNNAYKFTDEGGAIEVSVAPEKRQVVCSVRDSGTGISKDDLAKLFHKFQQVGRQAGEGPKGTGLGLAITKALVEAHGGRIWVESQLEVGTTVFFSLPLYIALKEKFEEEFDALLKEAAEKGESLGLLVLRIGNVEDVISEKGEQFLSEVMNTLVSEVADRLFHPKDKVFLYGRDSVQIILPETTAQGVSSVLSGLKTKLAGTLDAKDGIDVDLQFGKAVYPAQSGNREELVRSAFEDIGKPREILVIDDHPDILEILRARLEKKRYRVSSALTGEDALELLEDSRVDLIILEVMIPGMSGYEVLGRLKGDPATAAIPVVILTAQNIETVGEETPEAYTIPVLSKKGDISALLNLIHRMD